MTKNDAALIAIRGFALVLLVVSGIGLIVGGLHALEVNYLFPPSNETLYRTTYICIEIIGKCVAIGIALVLSRRRFEMTLLPPV